MDIDNSRYTDGAYNNGAYNNNGFNTQPLPQQDEEGSNIDYFGWFIRIIRSWWLFVISLLICMTIAFFKNKQWQPNYSTSALVIIEENKGMMGGSSALMQGFAAERAYRNVNNQVIMFGSFELISRVIELHPELTVDYYTRGRFKVNNLYKHSPIDIQKQLIVNTSYLREFEFEDAGDSTYHIIVPETKEVPEITLTGRYGEPLETSYFFITVNQTSYFYPGCKLKFRFFEKEQLAMDYSSRLAFDFVMQGASVVRCTVVGSVPERDQDFLNGLCDEFLANNLARKNDAAVKTIDFIDEQLATLSDSIKLSEGRLNSYKATNFVSSTAGSSMIVSQYNSLIAKQTEMRLQEAYFKYLSDYLQNNVEDGSLMTPTSLGLKESTITGLITKYTETQIKRNEVGDKSPLYAKYNRELGTYKVQINEALKNIRVEMEIERADLNKRMAEIEEDMREQPYKEQQLMNIQRRFKLNDDYYTFLMQKRADAQIQKASNSPDNIILERARFSSLTNAADKNKNTSTLLIIGLLIPFGIIVLRELTIPYIRSEQEIAKLSAHRGTLLGIIRHTRSKSPVIIDKHPRSSVAESYRVLRTQVEYQVQRKENITVMLTSTQSGDGKTYISANMAGVYAITGRKTILIDLDLRKPSVSALLGLDANKGVSDYLIGNISLDQAITQSDKYKFDILTVGSVPPNPGELLKSERMRELMVELKKRYCYIVIDTSPIGLVADAYSMFGDADIMIYSVRCGKTNKKLFKNTVNSLFMNGVTKINYVFNDVNLNKIEYSRYYTNYYGAYGNYGNNSYGYYGYGRGTKGKKDESYFDYFDEADE